jgi:hypothetical protein
MYCNHTFLTKILLPLLWPSWGWNYYKNTKIQCQKEYETKLPKTNATTLYLCILVIIPPWKWWQWRPKRIDFKCVIKMHHKHWSEFCWLFVYVGSLEQFRRQKHRIIRQAILDTVCSESRCALRLRYVDLVVGIEVAVQVYCCFIVFSC